jgi:hypothetical protein
MVAATLLVSVVAFGGRASAATQYQIAPSTWRAATRWANNPDTESRGAERS